MYHYMFRLSITNLLHIINSGGGVALSILHCTQCCHIKCMHVRDYCYPSHNNIMHSYIRCTWLTKITVYTYTHTHRGMVRAPFLKTCPFSKRLAIYHIQAQYKSKCHNHKHTHILTVLRVDTQWKHKEVATFQKNSL